MSEAKKQNFLHGAAIMTATTVIVKMASFLYKTPLGSMALLGDEGYAHFLVAYNIYSFFLTLATAGFPVALSRMISAADTLDKPSQVQRIFTTASGVMAVIGGTFTLIMLVFNRQLSTMMGDTDAALSIVALAPAVLLVCMTATYRGYCQGRSNMIPTAYGQVIEEVGKLIVGLALAWLLVRGGKGLPAASAGAILGVTVGSGLVLAYMVWYKHKYYPSRPYGMKDIPDSRQKIMKEFLSIGIPIALGASVLSLVNLLDNGLCLNRLQDAAGFAKEEAWTLYGAFGKAQTFYNLPSYFITPLTLSVVPAVTACLVKGEHHEASKITESSLRIAAVIALPMGIGLAVLAHPIYNVIYWGSHEAGAKLLVGLGIASFFVCMTLLGNALLQACGKERLPIVSIAVGGVAKIGINWVLVGNPDINIYGAPIASVCCFGIICVMDYIFLSRAMSRRPRLSRVLGAPLLSAGTMGVAAWAVYGLAGKILSGGGELDRLPMAIAMFAAIAVAVVVYLVMISATRAVTKSDMALIPGGHHLTKILHLHDERQGKGKHCR